MKVVSDGKCFGGPDGVYYESETDIIYLLERGEMHMFYDQNNNRLITRDRYRVWNGEINGQLLCVVGHGNLIALGEL